MHSILDEVINLNLIIMHLVQSGSAFYFVGLATTCVKNGVSLLEKKIKSR